MKVQRVLILLISTTTLAIFWLGGCAPAAAPTREEISLPTEIPKTGMQPSIPSPSTEVPPETEPGAQQPAQTESPAVEFPEPEEPAVPGPTSSPLTTPLPTPIASPPASPEPILEEDRIVQVEWPSWLRLGESDTIRLALIPQDQGYLLITEYPENQVITQTINVQSFSGFERFAAARLDGVGFDISPSSEQTQYMLPETSLIWRWSVKPRQSGDQRIAVSMTLRWLPMAGNNRPAREVLVYSRSLDIHVFSFMGLTQPQVLLFGLFTLLFGSGLGMVAVILRPKNSETTSSIKVKQSKPNSSLEIDLPPSTRLSQDERNLFQTLFFRYKKVMIEHEFLSGYSGARTFLTLPVRNDDRNDAYTIVKIGAKTPIIREFQNYERFVKDTLPPITARIQRPPVAAAGSNQNLAALQYTFIGEPGKPPRSLRQVLIENPDPSFLIKLRDTFGPNWWMQRKPYTFRIAAEYDRMLPTHLVIEPDHGSGSELDGRLNPLELSFKPGDKVAMRNFIREEIRNDGVSQSLLGVPAPGFPPLRVRWLSLQNPDGATGRVVATRATLLENYASGLDRMGLPDPIPSLESILTTNLHGTQSILHGDLNLENILVGPGNLLWLIDFAQTREGHTLYDFAHLGTEMVAHIAAHAIQNPQDYLTLLRDPASSSFPQIQNLFNRFYELAFSLLLNPGTPSEFLICFGLSCLGGLKYNNLSSHSKQFLFLTAAHLLSENQP